MLFSSILVWGQESGSSKRDYSSSAPMTGISVTIGGSFIVNGSFSASPLERADQFVTRLFNQAKIQLLGNTFDEKLNLKLDNFARRDIKLRRISGEEINLDLEKFRLTGDFKYNPYLKNDDILIFPPLDMERNFVSVDGAVNRSIKFQFVNGDKLSDALLFAQGVSLAYANVTEAEITRLNYSGSKEELIKVKLDADIILQPGDRIRILADESNRKDYRALVLGEVEKPGYIPIAKDNVTLKEVIAKAGGFKEKADLYNSELIRVTDNYTYFKKDILTKSFEQNKFNNERIEVPLYENSLMEELVMLRTSYLKEEDSVYFGIDNKLRTLRGNALVDFTKLNSENSNDSKFIVRDGDVILIPQKKELVYVFGQVVNAGYVKYVEGKDFYYYIQEAGGFGNLAKDLDEVSVIKAKSRAWVPVGKNNNDVVIEPGDYIWVPKKTPHSFNYYFDLYMKRVGEVASIVGTIVTIILLTRK
jgi:protein involved in polysaccharide export with SLBB domain